MPRIALCLCTLFFAGTATAQRVPGRDLLTYPLGLTGEPAALSSGSGSGLWNPATAVLEGADHARLGAAALSAPIDLGLSGQEVHGALAVRGIGTFSLGIAHAAVTDLLHTDTDPQSVGDEIPYNTVLLSEGYARRVQRHVVVGAAVRAHNGDVEGRSATDITTDGGLMIDGLTPFDARVAVSSFLWTASGNDAPVFSAAGDVRVVGPDSAHAVRAGLGYVATRDATIERYPYLDGRLGALTVRGGPVRTSAFGTSTWRMRLGLTVQHGGYTIGIAREDNEGGLSPTYQLSIAAVYR